MVVVVGRFGCVRGCVCALLVLLCLQVLLAEEERRRIEAEEEYRAAKAQEALEAEEEAGLLSLQVSVLQPPSVFDLLPPATPAQLPL